MENDVKLSKIEDITRGIEKKITRQGVSTLGDEYEGGSVLDADQCSELTHPLVFLHAKSIPI